MEEILTYIGTIASICSVPLAIYLYLKGKEDRVDDVRRQILKIISYQIGENRKLSIFEIDKVIRSNARNNKIPLRSITSGNVLEDLISDTISSPLLSASRKDEVLNNVSEIFPDPVRIDIGEERFRVSTIYATSLPIISLFPLAIILLVGEEGWNSKLSWWFSFNTIEGYLPNVLFSIGLAVLGMLSSFIFLKLKSRLKVVIGQV